MTVTNFVAASSHATDAALVTSAQAIHDALIATGAVQTADTGQVAISSLIRQTTGGYTVYKIPAAILQDVADVYVRINWNNNGTSAISTWSVTIGMGTNGAGTILNTVVSERAFNSSSTPPTGSYSCRCTSGDGWFNLALWTNIGTPLAGSGFHVEAAEGLDDTTITAIHGVVMSAGVTTAGLGSRQGSVLVGSPSLYTNSFAMYLPAGYVTDSSALSMVRAGDVPFFNYYGPTRYFRKPFKNLVGLPLVDVNANVDIDIDAVGEGVGTFLTVNQLAWEPPQNQIRLAVRSS